MQNSLTDYHRISYLTISLSGNGDKPELKKKRGRLTEASVL